MTTAPALYLLLPPSEGKSPGGTRPGWRVGSGRFGRALRPMRLAIAEALAAADGGDAALLGVRGDLLDRALQANASVLDAPTLPAWQRFTGVVWDHLDVAGLSPTARERAARSVLVVHALAGISALDDPLPDFRLKLSASLPPLGRLAGAWRPLVSRTLNRACAGALVVDLLPGEHAAAWAPQPGRFEHVRVQLVGPDGRTAGHTAKAAKGLLARALLETDDPRSVLASSWSHDGHTIRIVGE